MGVASLFPNVMTARHPRNPFVNKLTKTAYYFADGMTDEEASRALWDPRCQSVNADAFLRIEGEEYTVVQVSELV
jgi:hypothetical protein